MINCYTPGYCRFFLTSSLILLRKVESELHPIWKSIQVKQNTECRRETPPSCSLLKQKQPYCKLLFLLVMGSFLVTSVSLKTRPNYHINILPWDKDRLVFWILNSQQFLMVFISFSSFLDKPGENVGFNILHFGECIRHICTFFMDFCESLIFTFYRHKLWSISKALLNSSLLNSSQSNSCTE